MYNPHYTAIVGVKDGEPKVIKTLLGVAGWQEKQAALVLARAQGHTSVRDVVVCNYVDALKAAQSLV